MEKSYDEKEDPLHRFDDREREVIQSQLRMPVVNVGYRTLYRYASGTDILVMSFCSFCAAVAGAVLPLMTVRYQAFQFPCFHTDLLGLDCLWTLCRPVYELPVGHHHAVEIQL
jgi:hypothetical protein